MTGPLARGEFATAVTHFRKGLDLAPTSLSLRQKLAVALSVSGDLQGAGQELLEVLRRSPEFAPAHYSLGVLLLSNGRDDLAIDRFTVAVQVRPDVSTSAFAAGPRTTTSRKAPACPSAVRGSDQDGPSRPGSSLRRGARVGAPETLPRSPKTARRSCAASSRQDGVTRALARLYAAAPDDRVRDGQRALALAQDLVRRQRSADELETMAMALAEVGSVRSGRAVAGRSDRGRRNAWQARSGEKHGQ